MRGWDHLRADHLTAQARTQGRAHGEGIASAWVFPEAMLGHRTVKVRLGLPREYKAKVRQRGPVHLIQQLPSPCLMMSLKRTVLAFYFALVGLGATRVLWEQEICIEARNRPERTEYVSEFARQRARGEGKAKLHLSWTRSILSRTQQQLGPGRTSYEMQGRMMSEDHLNHRGTCDGENRLFS